MLHSLYHQLADFVNSVFIHLVKKTERNVMGKHTEMLTCLFIFLTNPNSDCNKSACLINKNNTLIS